MSTVVDFRTCPLCEATCGLRIELDGREVSRRAGRSPTTSSAAASSAPREPASPSCTPIPIGSRHRSSAATASWSRPTWDEAFAAIDAGLAPILADGDRNAVGAYLGNPNAHTLDGAIHLRALLKGLGSRNVYSASSVDQLPKQVAVGLMFGAGLAVPIPDVDRTDHLLVLGANPLRLERVAADGA